VGQWVRKSEAAALFGVSERTIDNRVAAGKLQKRRHPYGVTEIFVDDETAPGAAERFERASRRSNEANPPTKEESA
jgi:hypothetical protein